MVSSFAGSSFAVMASSLVNVVPKSSQSMPTNAPTLAVMALLAYYVFNGLRAAAGDDSAIPAGVKPANLMYVQALGYHMLMDACFMVGVLRLGIAHVMMPSFVVAMLVEVYSHFITDDLPGAAPAGAFALVFACLARGAPARKPSKWNLATVFYTLQGILVLVCGVAMLLGDDAVIPEQMKPMDSLKVKHVGTTELTLAAYLVGSVLTGHAQAMQVYCGLFLLIALMLHVVIGDIEGCPMIVGLAMAHICLGLFWKGKDIEEAKKQ